MMMGRRRFVNLVAENVKRAVFSVHRLNVSEHLFYPSTAEAEKARPVVSTLGELPPPAASFHTPLDSWGKGQVFALVSPRRCESRILWSNPLQRTTLIHDVESHFNYELEDLSYKGLDPITISIAGRPVAPEDDLYVMSSGTAYTGSFQVFRFGRLPDRKVYAWQLESLSQPPLPEGASICSHAVLHDGRTICITAASVGTGDTSSYLFDTVKHEWCRAPDGWDLPFYWGAEHVTDLKLWLGLRNRGRDLFAWSDLSAAVDEGKAPTLKHQWEILEIPKEWQPAKAGLINIGEGRFCIFRVIPDVVPEDFARKRLALLTGVEIISSPVEHGDLRMVAHKSLSYIFDDERIRWVL